MHRQMIAFCRQYAGVLALAFAIGLFMPSGIGNFLKADLTNELTAQAADTYGGLSVSEALIKYHRRSNELSNEFLDRLTRSEAAVLNPVASDEDCSEEHVSTYCLAVKLNEELTLVELYLDSQRESIDTSLLNSTTRLEDAFELTAQNQELIEREIEFARDTLDLTLAVYNQVQWVYPVHKEMMTLISHLEAYRGHLADIRDVIELYPSKFNGATTLQCK